MNSSSTNSKPELDLELFQWLVFRADDSRAASFSLGGAGEFGQIYAVDLKPVKW